VMYPKYQLIPYCAMMRVRGWLHQQGICTSSASALLADSTSMMNLPGIDAVTSSLSNASAAN
jgi:hypothetical protein